jgi:hypothetical protein
MGGEQQLVRYTDTQIKDALLAAVDLLVQRDGYLLEHALYEPALTHRIAVYLEGRLDGYHVDCEYDQKKGGPKNLPKYGNARPDILVHRRGENHPTNLLAVEAKKVGNNCAEDLGKLRELKDPAGEYRYQVVAFVLLGKSGATVDFGDGDPTPLGKDAPRRVPAGWLRPPA